MKEIKLYSDGGSINNGGKDPNKPVWGAYCTLIVNVRNEIQQQFCEIFPDVTNNQMELYGGIKGIEFLRDLMRRKYPNEKLKIHIYSDSQYLIKGAGEWIHGWKKKGWKNSSRKTVENIEMWKNMDALLNDPQLEFTFNWVKGHKGKRVTLNEDANVFFNELCDTELTKLLDEER